LGDSEQLSHLNNISVVYDDADSCIWRDRYIEQHIHNVKLEEKAEKLKKKLEELKSKLMILI